MSTESSKPLSMKPKIQFDISHLNKKNLKGMKRTKRLKANTTRKGVIERQKVDHLANGPKISVMSLPKAEKTSSLKASVMTLKTH